MIQRRLRVMKWLSALRHSEFAHFAAGNSKFMTALKRTTDVQASLLEQFDKHECEPEDTSQPDTRVNAAVLLRQEPDDEDDDEDDRKEEDDDDDDEDGDGYSE